MKTASERDCRLFRPTIVGPDRLARAVARLAARHEQEAGGVLRALRAGDGEDYPEALERRLGDLEPQFFLRNVPRAELHTDDVEFEHLALRAQGEDAHAAALAPLPPPAFPDQTSARRLLAHREEMRQLFFHADWTRHFGHELKAKLAERRRAIWTYDPEKESL